MHINSSRATSNLPICIIEYQGCKARTILCSLLLFPHDLQHHSLINGWLRCRSCILTVPLHSGRSVHSVSTPVSTPGPSMSALKHLSDLCKEGHNASIILDRFSFALVELRRVVKARRNRIHVTVVLGPVVEIAPRKGPGHCHRV